MLPLLAVVAVLILAICINAGGAVMAESSCGDQTITSQGSSDISFGGGSQGISVNFTNPNQGSSWTYTYTITYYDQYGNEVWVDYETGNGDPDATTESFSSTPPPGVQYSSTSITASSNDSGGALAGRRTGSSSC